MLSFPEAIANERSTDPLHTDSPSSRLRRKFFNGLWIGPEEAETIGTNAGLMFQVVRNMEEWGFEFDRVRDGGVTKIRLKNTAHVPTVRVKRSPKQQAVPDNKRGWYRQEIRKMLLAGETLTTEMVIKRIGGAESNLRKTCEALENEGYSFTVDKSTMPWKYTVHAKEDGSPTSKAVVPTAKRSNGHQPRVVDDDDDLPEVPRLGAHVKVFLSSIDETDGSVILGLKNGSGVWQVKVEAYLEPEAALTS